jgi:hypothetical protein
MSGKPIKRVSVRRYRGAGDILAKAAAPIANAIDRIAGTHLSNCQGCAARRKWLNEHLPMPGGSVDTNDGA